MTKPYHRPSQTVSVTAYKSENVDSPPIITKQYPREI